MKKLDGYFMCGFQAVEVWRVGLLLFSALSGGLNCLCSANVIVLLLTYWLESNKNLPTVIGPGVCEPVFHGRPKPAKEPVELATGCHSSPLPKSVQERTCRYGLHVVRCWGSVLFGGCHGNRFLGRWRC